MNTAVRSHGFTALGPLHEAFARLTGWAAAGAALLLGAFSAVAFAPFHFSAVLALSFTGLIWMIDGARGHRRWGRAVFMRTWAFGVGFTLISMHWTAEPFLVEPERFAVFLWMPLILLPAGMALIWGFFGAMAGAFWSASPSRVFVFAFFFALAEFVRGHLFGGFPWNLPGTTWVPGGALSQAASLGGVYWLTLLTVFVMAAPAAMVDTRDARGLVLRIAPSFGAVILLAVGWAWGAQRIAAPSPLTEQSVVLMDSGVPQDEKWEVGPDPVMIEYLRMMTNGESKPGDIIVWPEGAVPTSLLNDINALDAIGAYLGPRTLIAGTTRYQLEEQNERAYFNSLVVLDENVSRSGAVALYDKFRLVPFGELAAAEIVPFGQALSDYLPGAMQQLARNGFRPGTGPAVIFADNVPPFVALICYEGLYPEITRAANLAARADWIVLVSNDAWFGGGMGPAQHYAQNRYRSIESGLPMVRVASRGASAIIDGYGREVLRATPVQDAPSGWNTTFGRGKLPAPAEVTLFQSRAGVVLFWLTLAAFVGLAFASWRR
ncbi:MULTISPECIES: apolipoprotein N-acyltransferase [Hyphomonas]|jgi:apolipoprotein N-acyltransferase|uniref:Apolipoprotein N-acyltransferase n=1 Tax=Hyphomonas jannaschiana VP2 TaxID=1280952 RepID=A0A059FD17_9PROT|nr:apolipoprotein N-acyltransferase [Hyphomonas jannaschiana]KCZ88441.1 apolipoprotein N-acyltransferase [Hyphomonas jannaschiana VP2]